MIKIAFFDYYLNEKNRIIKTQNEFYQDRKYEI